jgi:phosphoribosylaminoimidazole-succinocarboxamide synthase
MVPVECIARGYLAGGGLDSYRATGTIHDIPLPAGLAEGSRLPEPVFTPTTKAPAGQHDEPMTFAGVIAAVGADTAAQLRRISSLGLRATVFGFRSQADAEGRERYVGIGLAGITGVVVETDSVHE